MIIFLLTFAVFYVNGSIIGPMIQADESSHLLNAAAIAGHYNDFASSYHAGYSLLISPAFFFANGPEQAWFFVKIINGGLYFIGALFLLFLANRLDTGKSKVIPTASVIVAAIYPMWVVMVGYSFSQIGFFAAYVVLAYLVLRAVQGSTLFWLFSGIMAGFVYWLHPTGLAVGIALCLSALYESIAKKKLLVLLVSLTAVIIMILSYKYLFVPWLHERMTISGVNPSLHYPSIANILKSLFTVSEAIEFISRVAGHAFYLTIGTVGLVWAYFINRFYGNKQAIVTVPNTLVIFLSLSLLGVLALSVLLFTYTPEATRLDHWMYGRYIEGVIAPLILIGALSLTPRTQGVSIAVAIFASLVLMVGITEYTHTARMNVSAFWQDFYIRDAGLLVWCLSGISLILVSMMISRFSRHASLVFIGCVFIWMSSLQLDWHERASKNANSRSDLARVVRLHYPEVSCVGFDHSGINTYNKHVHWFDYGFVLYDYGLQKISPPDWMTECDGPLFSYDDNLDESMDIHRIGKSTTGGPTLWAKEPLPFIGTYPFIVQARSVDLDRVLDEGWHQMEAGHVWSTANAVLKLPVPELCRTVSSCEAVVSFSAFGASADRVVSVKFKLIDANRQTTAFDIQVTDAGVYSVNIPLTGSNSFQLVEIEIPQALSPSSMSDSKDNRVLGIALREIQIRE